MSEKYATILPPEISPTDELYWSDPVLWVRAAIGFESDRSASDISDLELATQYNDGGFAEWDPRVAQAVYDYLRSVGIVDLRQT